jgi:RecA/RadA recombinase
MISWWRAGKATAGKTHQSAPPAEPRAEPTNVTALLQAPISGTVAVGTHIEQRVLNLGGVHGGVVTIVEGAVVTPVARSRPVVLRPARPELVLDRQPLRGLALPSSTTRVVEVRGEPGSGKTTLLEELAWSVADSDYPDGVVYLSLNSAQLNDALHDIWTAFHECSSPYKPVDAQVRHDLGSARALLLLDDVDLEAAELHHVLHLLPDCRCIVATHDRRLWGEGRSIQLDGLPLEDAVPLLEHCLGRPLEVTERAQAEAFWQRSAGHPLRLQRSFVAAVEEAERTRRGTAGVLLPAARAEAEPDSGEAFDSAALERLLDTSASFDLVAYVQSQTDEWRAAALGYLSRCTPPVDSSAWTPQRLRLHSLLIEWGVAARHYEPALQLVRSIESMLAVRGYWDAWWRVLDCAYSAGVELSDQKTEAWALHQKGTRALCLGDMPTAESALAASLELRTRTGDRAGARVTRHNLELIRRRGGLFGTRHQHLLAGRLSRTLVIVAGLLVLFVAAAGISSGNPSWLLHSGSRSPTRSLTGSASPTQSLTGSASPTQSPSIRETKSGTGVSSSVTTSQSQPGSGPATSGSSPPTSASVLGTSAAKPSITPSISVSDGVSSPDASIPILPLPPVITATPSTVAFPATEVGLSVTNTVTITFTGNGLPVILLPSEQDAFGVDDSCAVMSGAGITHSCTLPVTFSPTSVGIVTATLTATLPDGTKVTVELTGTGSSKLVTVELVNDSFNYVPPDAAVVGNDLQCPGTCSGRFPEGTNISLTAMCPDDSCVDHPFLGWRGLCTGPAPSCTFAVPSPTKASTIKVHYLYQGNYG